MNDLKLAQRSSHSVRLLINGSVCESCDVCPFSSETLTLPPSRKNRRHRPQEKVEGREHVQSRLLENETCIRVA